MKRAFAFTLFTTLLFGNALRAFPEEVLSSNGSVLTLDQAVHRAFSEDDGISLARLRIEKEILLKEHAKRTYYPLVTTEVNTYLVTERKPGVAFWTTGLSVPLFDGGKRKSEVKLHTLKKEELDLAFKNDKGNLEYKVKEIYIRILSEKEIILLCESWVDESKRIYESFKTLYEKELATRRELYHAEALFKSASAELVRHKQALDYGVSLLRDALNLHDNEHLALAPLAGIKESDLSSSAFSNNPLYRLVKLRTSEKEAEKDGICSGLYPKLELSNRYHLAKDSFLDQHRFETGLEGTWNIWDFGATRSLMKAKDIERAESELEGRIEIRKFEEKVRELISNLKTMWWQIDAEKAKLQETKETYENEKTKLITNEGARINVFNSYLEYVKAMTSVIEIVTDYRLTEAQLVMLEGERDHER